MVYIRGGREGGVSVQFICTAFKREHVLIGERYTHMHTGVREGTSKRQTSASASASAAGERRGRGGGGETEAKIPPGDNGTVVGIFEKSNTPNHCLVFGFYFQLWYLSQLAVSPAV